MAVVEEVRRRSADTAAVVVAVAWIMAATAAALLVLRTSSDTPVRALGIALGAAAVPILLRRPAVTLVAVIVSELSNAGVVLDEQGIPGLGTALLVIAVVTCILGVRREQLKFTWSPIYATLGIFLAVRLLTLLLSEDPGGVIGQVGEAVRAVVFLLVLNVLLSVAGGIRLAVLTAVLTAAVLAGLSIVQEYALGNGTNFFGLSNVPLEGDRGASTARHAGPQQDANFWARTLLLFPPLALSLWATTRGRVRQAVWLTVVGALIGGLYLTQSRGALITLGLALIVWMALAGPRSRRLLVVAPTLILLATFAPGIGSRLSTLADLGKASSEAGDPSLIGRVAVQKVGFEIFRDNPVSGVGTGRFVEAEEKYERFSGLTHGRLLAPHNLYLEMAAEGGVAGLASWMLFYGVALWLPIRCILLRRTVVGDDDLLDRMLPVGVFTALVAWAASSIFLHLSGLRLLFLVIALGVALDVRARRLWPSAVLRAQPAPRPVAVRRWGSRAPLLVGALVVFLLMAIWTGVRSTAWQADARVVLQAREDDSRVEQAYVHDIAGREFLRNTVADVLADRDFVVAAASEAGTEPASDELEVSAVPSGTSSTISVLARGDDREAVVSVAKAVRAAGIDAMPRIAPLLELVVVPGEVSSRRSTMVDANAASASVLAAFGVFWVAGSIRWLRRRIAG